MYYVTDAIQGALHLSPIFIVALQDRYYYNPILQMRKIKLRKVEQLPLGHTAGKQRDCD